MARLLKKCVIVSGISIASFYCGIYYDKRTFNENLFEKFKNLPGLPLYGTVSAATTFSPVPQSMNRTSQIMKYGFPSLDNVKPFSDYVLSYDRRTRVAHWVFEHLTKESVKYNEAVDRSLCNFMPDESIHHFFRYILFLYRYICMILNNLHALYCKGLKIQIICVLDMIEGI